MSTTSSLNHSMEVKDLSHSDSSHDGPATKPYQPDTLAKTKPELHRTLSMTNEVARAMLNSFPQEETFEKNSLLELIDASTLDWDTPDDPDNPLNWPSWKKWLSTMTVAFICLCVTFGSSLYVGGLSKLEVDLHASQELALAGLSLYLVGLAFGPAVAAPLSELFGRRIVYLISLPVSMLFVLGIALSKNIQSVLVLRFFAGLFSSPALALAAGSISDVFPPEKVGMAMTFFCLAPFCGPILGPVIGNFVGERKDWQWTMWVNLMAFGILVPFVIILPETHKPVLLKQRALKRGLTLKAPELTGVAFLKVMITITLARPIVMLVTDPIILLMSVYLAFVFAVLFGFFEAFPIIFRGVYHMQLGVSGLPFLGVGVGVVLGAFVFLLFGKYVFSVRKTNAEGEPIPPTPEDNLIICKIGAISLPISLFWLAWTSKKSIHWIVPLLSGIPFGFGLIMIFFSVIVYLSSCFPPLSVASAMAANNLLRYLLASAFPLFTIQMYTNLGIDWATSTFAFISLAMVPVPWVLTKYGAHLRETSQFGYAASAREAEAKQATVDRRFSAPVSAESHSQV